MSMPKPMPGRAKACGGQCQACHALNPGQNGVGPYLHGVVGRPKHSAEGFSYSDALMFAGRGLDPGGPLVLPRKPRGPTRPARRWRINGMSDVEDRANLIAYLATQQ